MSASTAAGAMLLIACAVTAIRGAMCTGRWRAAVRIQPAASSADNPGRPSEAGLHADARAIWKFATDQYGIAPDRLVLFGSSLGGGVAVRLAADVSRAGTPPAGLILRSTFSSMTDAAAFHYPWLPVRLVLIDRYASVAVMPKVTCPVLQIHGSRDRIIPLELGRRLFNAIPERSAGGIARRFVELPTAGHNNVMLVAGPTVESSICQFFEDVRHHRRRILEARQGVAQERTP